MDLCERGDLSFTTTGKHRRVRRGDVETIQARTQRLTRDQRRSLWLAYAVAAHVVTSRSPKARELRQNSPFAGLLGEEERQLVLTAWRASEHAGRR